jgi:hypothetical protein
MNDNCFVKHPAINHVRVKMHGILGYCSYLVIELGNGPSRREACRLSRFTCRSSRDDIS